MHKWDQALYGKTRKAATSKAFTPGRLNSGKLTGYGFGWFVGPGFRNMVVHGSDIEPASFVFRVAFFSGSVSNFAQFDPGTIADKSAKYIWPSRVVFHRRQVLPWSLRNDLLRLSEAASEANADHRLDRTLCVSCVRSPRGAKGVQLLRVLDFEEGHEILSGRGTIQSGIGLPHSKTLARDSCDLRLPEGFGVRLSSAAMLRNA
jgi:hypothetical protein